jgi:hypothetical protein
MKKLYFLLAVIIFLNQPKLMSQMFFDIHSPLKSNNYDISSLIQFGTSTDDISYYYIQPAITFKFGKFTLVKDIEDYTKSIDTTVNKFVVFDGDTLSIYSFEVKKNYDTLLTFSFHLGYVHYFYKDLTYKNIQLEKSDYNTGSLIAYGLLDFVDDLQFGLGVSFPSFNDIRYNIQDTIPVVFNANNQMSLSFFISPKIAKWIFFNIGFQYHNFKDGDIKTELDDQKELLRNYNINQYPKMSHFSVFFNLGLSFDMI